MRGPYPNLFTRLVANTDEPENAQACWRWAGKADRWGYGRLNVWVPGLGDARTVQAHIALWVWLEAQPATVDDWWLAYCELQASGLELDHLCQAEHCCNPDHLDPVTPSENCRRRDAARARLHVEGF